MGSAGASIIAIARITRSAADNLFALRWADSSASARRRRCLVHLGRASAAHVTRTAAPADLVTRTLRVKLRVFPSASPMPEVVSAAEMISIAKLQARRPREMPTVASAIATTTAQPIRIAQAAPRASLRDAHAPRRVSAVVSFKAIARTVRSGPHCDINPADAYVGACVCQSSGECAAQVRPVSFPRNQHLAVHGSCQADADCQAGFFCDQSSRTVGRAAMTGEPAAGRLT